MEMHDLIGFPRLVPALHAFNTFDTAIWKLTNNTNLNKLIFGIAHLGFMLFASLIVNLCVKLTCNEIPGI